jgi:4-methyl-5(b-hydroxyethyl)-thiazole monophosphate biosynthesis
MGRKEVTGSHNIKITADLLFEEADFSQACMLILPGGMPGTNHLAAHMELNQLLIKFNNESGSIAAICAAPSVLGMNGILKGKIATCYPGFEDKLMGATLSGSKIESDSNIITGKGMGASIDFALCIIEQLIDKKTADKIAESIQYK